METMVVPLNLGMAKAFLLKGTRPVLVDTGIGMTRNRLFSALAAQNVQPEDIALIIITHGHSDHFGSVTALRARSHAKVAIHRLDADALRTGVSSRLTARGFGGVLLKFVTPPGRKPQIVGFEPDIILEDEFDLNPFGIAGKVVWTPGHTPGSVSVILESGEAIVGDLMGSPLSGRRPSIAFWAWNREKSIESIRKVLGFNPRVIYITHGAPLDPEAVRRLVSSDR